MAPFHPNNRRTRAIAATWRLITTMAPIRKAFRAPTDARMWGIWPPQGIRSMLDVIIPANHLVGDRLQACRRGTFTFLPGRQTRSIRVAMMCVTVSFD